MTAATPARQLCNISVAEYRAHLRESRRREVICTIAPDAARALLQVDPASAARALRRGLTEPHKMEPCR